MGATCPSVSRRSFVAGVIAVVGEAPFAGFAEADKFTDEVKKKVDEFFKYLDWAEDAGLQLLNGKQPRSADPSIIVGQVIDRVDYLKAYVANINLNVAATLPPQPRSPLATDDRAQTRIYLRRSTQAILQAIRETDQVADDVDTAADMAVQIRQFADAVRRLARLHLEAAILPQLGIAGIDLDGEASRLTGIWSDLYKKVDTAKDAVAGHQTALGVMAGGVRGALADEQALLRSDAEALKSRFEALKVQGQRKTDLQARIKQLDSQISDLNQKIERDKAKEEEFARRGDALQQDRKRHLADLDRAVSDLQEPFSCNCQYPPHTNPDVCMCQRYKDAYLHRRKDAEGRRDAARTFLDKNGAETESFNSELDSFLSDEQEHNSNLAVLSNERDDAQRELSELTDRISRDTEQLWKDAWISKADVFLKESQADDALVAQSL
jgi:hypothetical protein